MGTVYTLPVIEGLIAGVYDGISSSSQYWTMYNNVVTSGLYVCLFLDHYSNDTWRLYAAANSPNVKVAYYLQSNRLGSVRKSNPGIINANCVNAVSTTWHAYRGYQVASEWDTSVATYWEVRETNLDFFDSREAALAALGIETKYPITYHLTNCDASSAPVEAAVGDIVTVPFQFPSGYGIVNPSSDIYVTNNGVIIPSTYANGTLTFTMPDPS